MPVLDVDFAQADPLLLAPSTTIQKYLQARPQVPAKVYSTAGATLMQRGIRSTYFITAWAEVEPRIRKSG